MKPVILLYKVSDDKINALRAVVSMIGTRLLIVGDDMLGKPVGSIVCPDLFPVEESNFTEHSVPAHNEEFMLLCGFDTKMLDKLLNFMKKKRIGISLKAMLTETNKNWTLSRLITEITAERNMMCKQRPRP